MIAISLLRNLSHELFAFSGVVYWVLSGRIVAFQVCLQYKCFGFCRNFTAEVS